MTLNSRAALHSRLGAVASLILTACIAAAFSPPAAGAEPVPGAGAPASPADLFGDFYKDVALSGIFSDFKTFADATPTSSPREVLSAYEAQKPRSPVELEHFIDTHFKLEDASTWETLPEPGLPLGAHISALWKPLIRSSKDLRPNATLLPLPQPYAVPGGRFHELYYWDSYFTMLGFGPAEHRLLEGMVENFAHMIRTYGHIPNANRSYYLSRSQPPFFFKIVGLTSPSDEAQAFARFLPELKAEYAYWMSGAEGLTPDQASRNAVAMPDGSILNRYWDERDTPRDEEFAVDFRLAESSGRAPAQLYRDIRAAAESGWDFSSRWFADGKSIGTIETTAIVPVDLNSLLFGLEEAIRAGCAQLGDWRCAAAFSDRAKRRRAAIDKYLWDEKAGVYEDYEWPTRRHRGQVTAASLYPLFVKAATPHQAERVAAAVETRLLKAGGLLTTEAYTGQQWDAPNGWAPLQWIAVAGLRNYSRKDLAEKIARRWISTVSNFFDRSGRILEKYDVVSPHRPGGGGEYALQDGFGWTNGVTKRLLSMYRL
ncbi:MAG: alpha,alpha-trehalase TreF [Parvibaculum sp.]|uniref:alpha,alpha-trehalase TreF n=1 Tax=Parvibaculum sp. TaxID=2024848 RepID=UPI0025DC192E|nr:alpha,alpha-trehalase TreF [Parvibaculum sp.]MCE9650481.1 alpha,alpha-trehalase TreF [Parvibaculum sp.]